MTAARKKILIFLGLLVLIGLAYWQRSHIGIDLLVQQIRTLGPWGPAAYIFLYLIAPSLLIPGSAITLAGGALFGPFWGTLYTIFGATGGASLAFLIGRYLAGDWVEKKSKGMMKRLKDGVEQEGWRFVAFTRLVPLFPFNVLNYAFGLTKIRFFHYVVASFFCMLPGAAAYTFIGYTGREAALGGKGLVIKIAAAAGLLLFVSMLPRLIKAIKGDRK